LSGKISASGKGFSLMMMIWRLVQITSTRMKFTVKGKISDCCTGNRRTRFIRYVLPGIVGRVSATSFKRASRQTNNACFADGNVWPVGLLTFTTLLADRSYGTKSSTVLPRIDIRKYQAYVRRVNVCLQHFVNEIKLCDLLIRRAIY